MGGEGVNSEGRRDDFLNSIVVGFAGDSYEDLSEKSESGVGVDSILIQGDGRVFDVAQVLQESFQDMR